MNKFFRDNVVCRYLPVGLVVCLGVFLSITLCLLARKKEAVRVNQEFEQRAAARAAAVQSALERQIETLLSLKNFFAYSEAIDAGEFAGFAADMLGGNVGLRTVCWLPRVAGAERATAEADARKASPGNNEIPPAGDAASAPDQAEFFRVQYVEPAAARASARGWDFASDPALLDLLKRARATDAPAASEKRPLFPGSAEEGFLMCLAVNKPAGAHRGTNAAPVLLMGYVVGLFHVGELVEHSLRSLPAGGLDIAIYDEQAKSNNRLVYFHNSRLRAGAAASPRMAPDTEALRRRFSFPVAGRPWRMEFAAAPGFLASQSYWLPWTMLLGGLFLTFFLSAYMLNALGARARVERVVSERTTQLECEIAERTHAEQALRDERASLAKRVEERTIELTVANEELARAARLKDEFLASMSHELRTPLNAVLGLSEALLEEVYGPLNAKQMQSLRTIQESGRHLLSLINDILDLSKIEAGKAQLQISSVAIEPVCQASLLMVKQTALKKHLALSCKISSPVPTFMADERRLKQILVNLLSNAVKFTPENGGVGLEVTADLTASVIRFTVWDTGLGIAPQDQERLFRPFVQLDSRLSRQFSGTGLGLALVRRMSELHGGKVELESELEKGSRFTITLPLTIADTAGAGPGNASGEGIRHALIIEDSIESGDQLARYLGEWGIRSTLQRDAICSVKKAVALQPDLILLDINFTAISGWDILRELQSHTETRAIPTIIVSVEDERERGLRAGAADYLVKPITRQQLQVSLDKLRPATFSSATPPIAAGQAAGDPNAPLILVADDNDTNLTTVSDYLAALGYRVMHAHDGVEAVALAREVRPNLILMDIQMPNLDGLEATRYIRADASLGHTRIIALTALAMPGDRERCLGAGANEYFTKPVSLKQLASAIESELRCEQLAKAC